MWLKRAVLICGLLSVSCNQLFYFPSRRLSLPLRAHTEAVEFQSRDGTRLRGLRVFAEPSPAKATVVQFHGNAGNVTTHIRSVSWLLRRGYDLLLFDYRGYGESEGFPTPEGVHEDALAALDYAAYSLPRLNTERDLVLLGQSLGGAVLLRAFAERRDLPRVRYVVIEGSFHSYQEVAAGVTWRTPVLFPFTGVAYGMVSDDWAPAPYVADLSPVPLLFVHGLDDEVVDPAFSFALFSLSRAPRSLLAVPDVGHQGPMAVCAESYRRAFISIIEHPYPNTCARPNVDNYLCEALGETVVEPRSAPENPEQATARE